MDIDRLWVYFKGEVSGINSGWRVTEVEIGRKWVYVKTTGAKRRHKITKRLYESMPKREFMEAQ